MFLKKDRLIQEKGETSLKAGLEYLIQQDFTNALKLFDEALYTFKSASWPNIQCIARTLHHIGIMHKECLRLNEAIKYFDESLLLQRKYAEPNYYRVANTLRSMGASYELLNKIEKAFEFYEESLEMQKKKSDAIDESKQINPNATQIDPLISFLLKANTLYSLGSMCVKLNKMPQAIEFYMKCLKVQRGFKLKNG